METSDGEVHQKELRHDKEEVRGFYAQLAGEVIVGFEASGYSAWFEEMLEELGHQIWVGHASEIRRCARSRHKNDKRDADLLLELMVKGEFPRIHRQRPESREVLRQLRYRHRLVKMRTTAANSLQAIAIGAGLAGQVRLGSRGGVNKLGSLKLPTVLAEQRKQWLEIMAKLTQRIKEVEKWLGERAEIDEKVTRLRTHPGIGLLSGLVLVHTLDPVERFSSGRKVAAYVGLDPLEDSSADKKRFGRVSKAGSKLVRFLLVEAGQTAARNDPQLKSFYKRVSKSRKTAKAKVAVARKLAIRGYIMLRDQIDYAEFVRRGALSRAVKSKASNA
jgi:transposase